MVTGDTGKNYWRKLLDARSSLLMKEELVLGVRFTALPNRTCAYFCSQVSSELATDDPLANKFDVV